MTDVPEADARTEDLRSRLAAVHGRIDRATADAGRDDRPELIVVTKFFPVEDVLRLAALGVRDVGENRDQEASAKADAAAAAAAASNTAGDLRWHFIGQLQSNKARSVVRYARSVHSVDRSSLVRALGRAAAEHRPADLGPLACWVQVDLSSVAGAAGDGGGRGGADLSQVLPLADAIAATDGLTVAGVMAVAPLGVDPDPAFARLARIAADLRAAHPSATGISAGMSADLESAIAHGATHLRVGSDVLGPRPAVG
ncbi:YggS family pyridoxal phosphate enzyme [Tersicoccus sp. Bi-70]|uniref:YggS family pyridoxal phosphate enzyme n=1 Tax=Tersicoccus sp. Bi-70 TaxID=1897634 RepID=UPI00097628D2|nr:alanine racemase [Tersicoccus sp. Bi-70]OMH33200.1 YggS family pyridoxal phosphate enzyme [Tersicoccus sp. Bi-70]